MTATKVCSKCGEAKSFDRFNKDASTIDGMNRSCRTCISAYKSALRKANPEHAARCNARAKAWREENADRNTSRQKHYHQKNKAVRNAKSNAWKAMHPEKNKAITNKWRNENKEKITQYSKDYRAKNLLQIKERETKNVEFLTDTYVRRTFVSNGEGFSSKIVPKQLIEAKRIQLQIKRLLKERKQ